MSTAEVFITADSLIAFAEALLSATRVSQEKSRLVATSLVAANLRGVDSHGVARLRTYFDMLSLGRINPRPNVRVVRELPATATVDGDNGLGLVVGPKANEIALAKAEQVGSAWVSVWSKYQALRDPLGVSGAPT